MKATIGVLIALAAIGATAVFAGRSGDDVQAQMDLTVEQTRQAARDAVRRVKRKDQINQKDVTHPASQ